MESKIFNGILHGSLKPWKRNANNTRRFAELLKSAKAIDTASPQDLHAQVVMLLQGDSEIIKHLSPPKETSLNQLSFTWEFPKYFDIISQYYFLLINAEALRFYNTVLHEATAWTDLVDIKYQVGKILNGIKVLAKQTSEELREHSEQSNQHKENDATIFALFHLKQTLIQLYFSIQDAFKVSLGQVITLEDFYIIELEEPLTNIFTLIYIGEPKLTKEPIRKKTTRLSFGFNNKPEKIKVLINALCFKVDLLQEEKSPADLLIDLMLSKDIKPGKVKIYLGCDNKTFRYVINSLSIYFDSLTLSKIESSQSFFSKSDKLIKANDLSKAAGDCKRKEEIDKIMKQTQ